MSKLSFRARALDASKSMPIFECSELPDLPDFTAINRAVPQMPTGMEKEEETEHHLQRALSAQQVYGTSEALVIPTPDITQDSKYVQKLYPKDFKTPKQYIHVQAFNVDHEIPDYDMDSEDETWLQKQSKKMEVAPVQFEEMMDRLEKGSGQTVVTLPEAKMLLKEDDDLIIAVYDYWLNKRLRTQHHLIPTVRTEKRDGSTTNNPYVAFRRRTEKMQTRKNRKNDEVSYEKMLKLRRDLSKAVTQLEMIKRREKTKKELLQLTIEIVEKRFQMGDFNGEKLAEAQAQKHKLPAFIPVNQFAMGRDWSGLTRKEENNRKKRDYKKRKHRPSASQSMAHGGGSMIHRPSIHVPQYSEVDILTPDLFSSDEDLLSPAAELSPSDHEDDANDPDGVYAFKRMRGCSYLAPVDPWNRPMAWPWSSGSEHSQPKYRYNLTSISEPRRCVGYARRRYGRGGRLLLDRAFSEYDPALRDLDLMDGHTYQSDRDDYYKHIRDERIPHYRPQTPPSSSTLPAHRSGTPPLCDLPEELSFDSGMDEPNYTDDFTDTWTDLTASLTPSGLVLDATSPELTAILGASQTLVPASFLTTTLPEQWSTDQSEAGTSSLPTTQVLQLHFTTPQPSSAATSTTLASPSTSQPVQQTLLDSQTLPQTAASTTQQCDLATLAAVASSSVSTTTPMPSTSFTSTSTYMMTSSPSGSNVSGGSGSSSSGTTTTTSDANKLAQSLLRFSTATPTTPGGSSTAVHDDQVTEVNVVEESDHDQTSGDSSSSPVGSASGNSSSTMTMPMEVT